MLFGLLFGFFFFSFYFENGLKVKGSKRFRLVLCFGIILNRSLSFFLFEIF